MPLPRLATFAVNGEIEYGAVTDGGIVDLSARFGDQYPTLREVIAAGALARLAEDAARSRAGLSARRRHLAAADPVAGKDHLHRRQLSGPQRRVQGRPGRAEISQHVHAHAALVRRPRHAAGAAARIARSSTMRASWCW